MSASVATACAIALCAMGQRASAQTTSGDTAEIRTAATARRSVRPTQAAFTVQFSAEGRTPAQAGQRLAARADSVRRALMILGVARDSLVTGSGWYWWPERIQVVTNQIHIPATPPNRGYQVAVDTIPYGENGWQYRPRLDTTYRAREILEVRMSDVARVGAAIDTLVALRITEISRVRFALSDPRAVQLELLREATARATEQASTIASASGGRLGRILYLGTQAPSSVYDRYGIEAIVVTGGLESSSASGTEITAPGIPVTITVYGRWQLNRP